MLGEQLALALERLPLLLELVDADDAGDLCAERGGEVGGLVDEVLVCALGVLCEDAYPDVAADYGVGEGAVICQFSFAWFNLVNIQLRGLQAAGVVDLLLGGDGEEDGLVLVHGVVLVGGEILHGGLFLLFLRMLLHVRNEALGGPFDLRGIQLVRRRGLLRGERILLFRCGFRDSL